MTTGSAVSARPRLLRSGRRWRGTGLEDLLIRDGVVAEVGAHLRPDLAGLEVIDLGGALVLPGLVDAHCHLDKTLFGGPWQPHSAGEALADRIGNERRRRAELGLPNPDYVETLLRQMLAHGTTYVRTHTDVYAGAGSDGIAIVDEAVARLDGAVDVAQIAFPQSGILINPGTAELLDHALQAGAAGIGGIDPGGMDRDPVRHLDVVFGLAERHGACIDIHLHDPGTLGAFELELIIERTRSTGLGGKVTVSHAYALAQVDDRTQHRLVDGLADAGITLTVGAVFDFPVPSLKKLRAAGVNVACGHDDIRDLWSPFGSGDMLDRAMHLAYRSTFRRDEDIELALDAATFGGARALGLDRYGLDVGDHADLVVVAGETPAHAVVTHPPRQLVLKRGHIVARVEQQV